MKGTYLSASSKRIQKELAEISLDPPCNCSAGPKGDNLHDWVSTLLGPTGDSIFRLAALAAGRLLSAASSSRICETFAECCHGGHRLTIWRRCLLFGYPFPA